MTTNQDPHDMMGSLLDLSMVQRLEKAVRKDAPEPLTAPEMNAITRRLAALGVTAVPRAGTPTGQLVQDAMTRLQQKVDDGEIDYPRLASAGNDQDEDDDGAPRPAGALPPLDTDAEDAVSA